MTNYIFLFLSSLGFLDAAFLTVQHYNKNPFSCPLFGGCGEVTSSIYSEIFGIPISLFGMLFYGLIFALSIYAFLKDDKRALRIAAQLTVFGFLTSLYLVYIMVYVLSAICFYCLMSAVSSTLLFTFGVLHLNKLKAYETKFVMDYIKSFSALDKTLGILRISLGFVFFWAFLDKAGLWFSGGLPAKGFLANGTDGVFASLFASGAESPLINSLYMFGLFAVGVALMIGITKKLATAGTILMMLFIYMAALPPKNNPLVDEHIIYILVALVLYFHQRAYETFGIYKYWRKINVVDKYKILS
jgi:thiosulfate dehydrogenase [quinone] large subunit